MSTQKVPLTVFSCMTLLMTMASFSTYTFQNGTSSRKIIEPNLEALTTRVAPGESLPFSIKLINFGIAKRVDAIVYYKIFDENNREIYSKNETVAVETSASFIRDAQLPTDIAPGTYRIVTEIVYADQVISAISEFKFQVERKIFGVFQRDFLWYVFLMFLVSAASAGAAHLAGIYGKKNFLKIKNFFSQITSEDEIEKTISDPP